MTPLELKNSILQLAIQGRLVEQRPEEGTGEALYQQIQAEKQALIKAGKINKEKPLPEITEDEILFEIPESWKWVRLGSAFCTEMGQSPSGSTVSETNNGLEFHQGKVYFGKEYLEQSPQRTTAPTKIAEPNSVLLCVRAPVGKVNILTRKICIGRGLCSVFPVAKMDVKFVYYLLSTFENVFIRQATGTTFVAITGEVVRTQPVPLPPLAEQKRIVAKIEELLPLIDRYEKAWSRLEDFNKRFPGNMQKSILQLAIQGRLVEQRPEEGTGEALYQQIQTEKQALIKAGKIKKEKPLPEITEDDVPFEIPESWKWVRVGEIGSWSAGATPSRTHPEYYGGNIPWLKTGDLNDGYIDSVSEHITELALQNSSVRLNPVGSVLMAMYGATIGKLGIANISMTTNQACCACIPYEGLYNRYLFFFLMAQRTHYIKMGEGGAQPNISKDKIVNSLMPLPPLAEQKRIVAKLEELLPLCERLK